MHLRMPWVYRTPKNSPQQINPDYLAVILYYLCPYIRTRPNILA
jgi:hypothetical protein